jgi:preprotein translocase subunit YajC
MGTMILAAASTTSKGNPAFTFIILAVLVVLFYVLIMRPQRNRQRKAAQTQNQVMPGQRVRTTAGMYGTVVSVEDQDVLLEIAPGVEVQFLRRAIMDVVPDPNEMEVPDTAPEEAETFDEAEDDAATGS